MSVSVKSAERDAQDARAQLMGTLTALRGRLAPRALAAEGADALAQKTHSMLQTTEQAARDRPMTAGTSILALIAAIGLRLWLARRKPADRETSLADAG